MHDLKLKLQDFFSDGLAIIVGSGLSIAEGLPSMDILAKHLLIDIPKKLNPSSKEVWEKISSDLNEGNNLESALIKNEPDSELERIIQISTAELILNKEKQIIEEVILSNRTLRFSLLLPHLLKPRSGFPVITTNYDRLIEVATEIMNIGIDTMFLGNHCGYFNEKQSRFSFCRGGYLSKSKSSIVLTYTDRLLLMKPHGSFDWFLKGSTPVRCPYDLPLERLIITPGLNKFRQGYEQPFDRHREKANREIDRASKFLIIGYGFNDDHLETHLTSKLQTDTPALVLTKSLSANAEKLISDSDNITAITKGDDEVKPNFKVVTKSTTEEYDGVNLWDLEEFVKEVLEP